MCSGDPLCASNLKMSGDCQAKSGGKKKKKSESQDSKCEDSERRKILVQSRKFKEVKVTVSKRWNY